MEIKESCKVLLNKGKTQKVKCSKFMHKELNRELAVHTDVDNKERTSVTDVVTGLRMCGIPKAIEKVEMAEVLGEVDSFLKHFTLEETLKELTRREIPCL